MRPANWGRVGVVGRDPRGHERGLDCERRSRSDSKRETTGTGRTVPRRGLRVF